MLLKEHIDTYRSSVLEAKTKTLGCIKRARATARDMYCEGCKHCTRIIHDEAILNTTSDQILFQIALLREGDVPTLTFPKIMTHDTTFYRGFITSEGKYLNLWNYDHALLREAYILTHGINHAYRMIKIHSGTRMSEVHFLDYKNTPTLAQYETLKQLMIDARGNLSFAFSYDTNHPMIDKSRKEYTMENESSF